MVERNRFGSEALLDVLQEVSTSLDIQVEAYLIGGLAMMQHGLKVTTKDVDIVFMDEADEQVVEVALRSLGFHRARELSGPYVALGATIIMERFDGTRFDIFIEEVCRKLRLTDGMRHRADELPLDGNLRLMAAAPEDLFLFKSVTDRDDDLADMALLAGVALDWEAMADELMDDELNLRYLPHYVVKLGALEKVHGVVSPGRRELEREAEIMMGINILEGHLEKTPLSISDATRCLGEEEAFSKKVLDRMVEIGLVRVEDGLYHVVGR